jgi:hypothetical protein
LEHPVQLFPPEGFHIVYLEFDLAEVLRFHTRVELVKAIFLTAFDFNFKFKRNYNYR